MNKKYDGEQKLLQVFAGKLRFIFLYVLYLFLLVFRHKSINVCIEVRGGFIPVFCEAAESRFLLFFSFASD